MLLDEHSTNDTIAAFVCLESPASHGLRLPAGCEASTAGTKRPGTDRTASAGDPCGEWFTLLRVHPDKPMFHVFLPLHAHPHVLEHAHASFRRKQQTRSGVIFSWFLFHLGLIHALVRCARPDRRGGLGRLLTCMEEALALTLGSRRCGRGFDVGCDAVWLSVGKMTEEKSCTCDESDLAGVHA